MLKSTKQVKVLNELAEDQPRGCNVGIVMSGSRGKCCGFHDTGGGCDEARKSIESKQYLE